MSCLVRTPEGEPAKDERLIAVALGNDGRPLPSRRELRATDRTGTASFRLARGRWRIAIRTFEGGKPTGQVPLGEWAFAEGEVRKLEMSLPRRPVR